MHCRRAMLCLSQPAKGSLLMDELINTTALYNRWICVWFDQSRSLPPVYHWYNLQSRSFTLIVF